MLIMETANRRSAGQKHSSIDQFISALAIALPAWGTTIHAVNTLLERIAIYPGVAVSRPPRRCGFHSRLVRRRAL